MDKKEIKINIGKEKTKKIKDNIEIEDLKEKDIPKGWHPSLWKIVWTIGNKMPKKELVLFHAERFIEDEANISDISKSFEKFSKVELVDLLDEIGSNKLIDFLKKYTHYLTRN